MSHLGQPSITGVRVLSITSTIHSYKPGLVHQGKYACRSRDGSVKLSSGLESIAVFTRGSQRVGPPSSSIGITWELVKSADSQVPARTTEWETLGVALSNQCFNQASRRR